MSETRERTIRERCERIIVEALAQENKFAGRGNVASSVNHREVFDAILAELRELDETIVEAVETGKLEQLMFGDSWRAAIDAIQGENAATKRPGQAQDDDAAR